jgi:uncharacterized DUF497 family protein
VTWFDWDPEKARSNERKHGISFAIAQDVFSDPDALSEGDRSEGGERRRQTLGLADGVLLLLVAHTVENDGQDEIIRIISARAPTGRRENDMRKSAKRTTASVLTAAQRRKVAALAAQPDARIDYSDIPPLTERFWENAVRNPFYRPIKQQLTVRLDADVIAWLRRQGQGYQTRLNTLLRSAMLKDLKKSA